MNILICVKQVPCVEKMKYDELTQTVLRQKDDLMLNPFDASTIEQALTLKQKYPSVPVSYTHLTLPTKLEV